MSEVSTGSTAPPRRPWVKYLLIGSLAFNALLAGVIIRAVWNVRAGFALTGGGLERGLPGFVDTLPAERRERLKEVRRSQQVTGEVRRLRREVRQARSEAARSFLAEPFDKQAFIAAQRRLSEAEGRLREASERVLPEIGERLTAAERRAYLAWRGHWRSWHGGRGRGGRSGDPVEDGGPREKDRGP